MVQTSGEAVYVADVGTSTRELFAAPVESTRALARLGKVDPSTALKLPGVVAFVGRSFFCGRPLLSGCIFGLQLRATSPCNPFGFTI